MTDSKSTDSKLTDSEYDSETSSDDEYEHENDTSYYPYNICKSGREYIQIYTNRGITVPVFEFEKRYGNTLQILRNGCKDVRQLHGSPLYYFTMYTKCNIFTGGKIYESKGKYINDDPEFHKIVSDFEMNIESHADDAPHRLGCSEEDREWYTESIGNYASVKAFIVDDSEEGLPFEQLLKLRNCSIKESYVFEEYRPLEEDYYLLEQDN